MPPKDHQTPKDRDSVTINAHLSWLVCKEDCIPGWATLSLSLPISDTPKLSQYAPLFEKTRQQLPVKNSAKSPILSNVNVDKSH